MTLVPPSSKYGNAGYVLGSGSAGYAHTGDVLETALVSVSIPAGALGLGMVEIYTFWTYNNSGNNKLVKVRFGAANDLTGTQVMALTETTSGGLFDMRVIRNRSAGAQVFWAPTSSVNFGTTGSAVTGTAAIDTTAQSYVVVSAQLANTGETIQLESYLMRLVPAV